eukprot:scaffold2347_cov287-Chaetoceros_neogracile.AAC.17
MYYSTSIILAATTALLSSVAPAAADSDDVSEYCVKGCSASGDDPCGDSKGQSDTCTAVTFDDKTMFGYTNMTMPTGFLGCSKTICATACANTGETSPMVKEGDTFCFPKRADKDGMFMTQDMAKLAAVGKGCSGAHAMGEMYMVGTMHSDCMNSYAAVGVSFGTSSSSSLTTSLFMGAAGALTAMMLV